SFLYDAGQSVFSDIKMVVFENKWYQAGVSELENCSKYKEGKFYYFLPESQSDTVNIIRFLNKQIDIYKGQEVETYLSLTSNCTYEYTIPGIGKGKTEILGEFQGGYLFFNSQEGMDKVVEKSFGKVYIKNK